jgi:signal transduction histidine kinase
MTSRMRSRLAWTIAVTSVLGLFVAEGLKFAFDLDVSDDLLLFFPVVVGAMAMGWVGAMIASRTTNPLGWILLAIPAGTSVSLIASTFTDHGGPTGAWYAPYAYWLNSWPFFAALLLFVAVFFLFPTGGLPSVRWRWPWRIYLGASVSLLVGFTVLPSETELPGGGTVSNPFGIPGIEPVLGPLLAVAGFTITVSAFVAFASLIVRYRGADDDERQQLRWLYAIGIACAVLFAIQLFLGFTFGDRSEGTLYVVQQVFFLAFVVVLVIGVPVAMGIAILRFHLYDLDVVIRKTVIALVLAALIGLITAAVLGIAGQFVLWGGTPRWVVIVVAATMGALFQPLLRLARRIADRLVFGRRATPYEVLTEFSEHVGETYAAEDVLPRMAQVLGQGIGGHAVTVWLRLEGELRPLATWPRDVDPVPIDGDAFPITHAGDELGALAIAMPADDPMDATKEKLARDLAAQAGLVLRNVRLVEELRASRRRIVTAQDTRAKALERNIHDGAQQQLVALAVQLRLLEGLVERDPVKAKAMAADLQDATHTALEDLRDLARGIYPPLLADKGLAVALEAQARKAAVPTRVDADGVGRYPAETEATVYFCVLEALNNVAKYAQARAATVSLAVSNGDLRFAVADDGVGFDPSVTGYGTGLQGMADRLDAVGGRLEIVSTPGGGTSVSGTVTVGRPR